MKYRFAAVAVSLIAAMGLSAALAQPKAPLVSSSWELECTLQDPQAIEVKLPGEAQPQKFWFIRYNVTNRTGEDQIYVPDFTLYTDGGQVVPAQKGVSPAVFRAIRDVYNDPMLKDPTSMTGKLLQGEDNAKDGVAIFRDFDPAAGTVDLFIGGLSGDTAEVKLPTPIEVTHLDPQGKKVTVTEDKAVLSRTLHLKYKIVTNRSSGQRVKLALVEKNWVMR